MMQEKKTWMGISPLLPVRCEMGVLDLLIGIVIGMLIMIAVQTVGKKIRDKWLINRGN